MLGDKNGGIGGNFKQSCDVVGEGRRSVSAGSAPAEGLTIQEGGSLSSALKGRGCLVGPATPIKPLKKVNFCSRPLVYHDHQGGAGDNLTQSAPTSPTSQAGGKEATASQQLRVSQTAKEISVDSHDSLYPP